eukprot:snap_masked-scaffold_4-processed-gene-13.19-mRNA-1 protein AED:1.00 eAED:1.00 QI:0/-1/0/0/-1/1/1/0/564
MELDKNKIPVIVGCGRITDKTTSKTPITLSVEALGRCCLDTGLDTKNSSRLLSEAVAIATTEMFLELRWKKFLNKKPYKNFPFSLSKEVGARISSENCLESAIGGNSPQYLINFFSEKISCNNIEQGPIFIGGCENNSSFDKLVRKGRLKELKSWEKNESHIPQANKVNKTLFDKSKKGYKISLLCGITGLFDTINIYAILENAEILTKYREQTELNLKQFIEKKKELYCSVFSLFSKLASKIPEHSWYPIYYRSIELSAISKENRLLSFPYTKNVVARDEVNQAAFICLMSYGEALRRNIPVNRIVFLHGSADSTEHHIPSLRKKLSGVPNMKTCYKEALRNADISKEEVSLCDIYSCFPIAVEKGLESLGLSYKDIPALKFTQTGGLPYHGGPGSNYSTHGLCALIDRLRQDKYRDQYGLLAANGGFLTKHSVGIYSTKVPKQPYNRRKPSEYAVDAALSTEQFELEPFGEARILGWTVQYSLNRKTDENIPTRGVIIGELLSSGKRCVGITKPEDRKTIQWLQQLEDFDKPVIMETGSLPVEIKGVHVKPVFFTAPPSVTL